MDSTKRITAIFIFIVIAYVVTQIAKYYSVSSDNYTPYYLFYAMLLLFYMVLPTKNAKVAPATATATF